MKKLYNLLIVLAVPALFLLTTSEVLFHSGSPGFKSGSPGDNGANCTDCHAGTPITEEYLMYSTQLLLQGYSPGQTYNFFVIGTDATASRYGFEATAEDASGNKVGTFEPGILGMTEIINDGKAITHNAAGSFPLTDSGTIWMFTWVAPPQTVGEIGFYAAINAANGNGQNSGDQIYLTQFMSSPATGVFERPEQNTLGLYPNPSNGLVHFNQVETSSRVDVLNLNGQMVYSETLPPGKSQIDLSSLKKGVYIVRIGDKSQRLIMR